MRYERDISAQFEQCKCVKMSFSQSRFVLETFKFCPIAAGIDMVSQSFHIHVCSTVKPHFSSLALI